MTRAERELFLHWSESRTFGRTIDLNAQTAPRPILHTGLKLSLESQVHDSRGGDFVAFDGKQ